MIEDEPHRGLLWQMNVTDEYVLSFISTFKKKYPTNSAALREITRIIKGKKPKKCEHCESRNLAATKNIRLLKCNDCSLYTWITAGSFFHGCKKPEIWLLAIHMWEAGIFLSSSRFHRLVGVAQSTALHIIKRLGSVVQDSFDSDEVETEIETSVFNNVFCKRSAETPAKMHPLSEQTMVERQVARERRIERARQLAEEKEERDRAAAEKELARGRKRISEQEVDEQTSDASAIQPDKIDQLNDREYAIYEQITDAPIHPDSLAKVANLEMSETLAALTWLELAGLIEVAEGGRFIRADLENPKQSDREKRELERKEQSFNTIMMFISGIHHGISRKHVQRYVASFWCFFDRANWNKGKLLKACKKSPNIREKDNTSAITPAFLRVPSLCLSLSDSM